MTVLEYLLRPETIQRKIDRKYSRIAALRRNAERLTAPPQEVRVQSTPDPAFIQTLLAEAADEELAISRLQEKKLQVLAETALYLSVLPDRQLSVMELHYLDGCCWKDTALRLDYSLSSVFRLHQQALSMLPLPPEAPEEDPA